MIDKEIAFHAPLPHRLPLPFPSTVLYGSSIFDIRPESIRGF